MKKNQFPVFLFVAGALLFSSCLKKSYDNPKDLSKYDPNLPVSCSIKDIVSPYWGVTPGRHRVLGDSTICGIVIADDRSGNFYKQTIIQDSTAGVNIVIDDTYLYGIYPVGRKLYIKLKGLILINYNNSPEICYSVDNQGKTSGIPAALEDSFIIRASYPHAVIPREVRRGEIDYSINSNLWTYTLLKIDDMEIDSLCIGKPYADPVAVNYSTPRNLYSCVGDTINGNIELYNSGFANFYNAILPSGYGSITGVFYLYSSNKYEFMIRDTTDVNFSQPRCHK